VVEGNFETRNKNITDIDWHYLDIFDTEVAIVKALIDNGTIKV
jgi:hypothetical protein